MLDSFDVFDSHLHIIDKAFPLVPNDGYIPDEFTHSDYLKEMATYNLCGGAVVSGSFQGFDQSYLRAALKSLGPSFVGVTQLPASTSDAELVSLNEIGVRALRFNLKRGGSEHIAHLATMASRVHEVVGWHVELYAGSIEFADLYDTLVALPAVSIDHLGLTRAGRKWLLRLAEKGARVKATGFGRVDFNVESMLKDLYSANPGALMFGTDLPSTRAPRAYADRDAMLIVETLGTDAAINVLSKNAIELYRPTINVAPT